MLSNYYMRETARMQEAENVKQNATFFEKDVYALNDTGKSCIM